MKIFLKLELPISFILFNLITKWWDINQADGPNRIFYGFPLRYKTNSLASSMCDEFFLFEMLIDFFAYLIVVLIISKFFIKKNVAIKIWLSIFLYVMGFIFFVFSNGLILTEDHNLFTKFNDNGFSISENTSGFSWFYKHNY